MCVEDTVELANIGLERYVKESKERLIVAVRGDNENTNIVADKDQWLWLTDGTLKRETESRM